MELEWDPETQVYRTPGGRAVFPEIDPFDPIKKRDAEKNRQLYFEIWNRIRESQSQTRRKVTGHETD
jgi:hypothetical protein